MEYPPLSDVPPRKVKEVLVRAIEVIERRGWCQDYLMDPNTGAVCAHGAIKCAGSNAITRDAWAHMGWRLASVRAADALAWVLTAHGELGDGCAAFGVPRWNDHPARTREEVIAALAKTVAYMDTRIAAGAPAPTSPDEVEIEDLQTA
jgi:hypothetical protein